MINKKMKSFLCIILLLISIISIFGCAKSQDKPTEKNRPASADKPATKDIPKTISWTSYDVGSLGYVGSAAIGATLKKNEGITLRVIPAGDDISRLSPVRAGSVDFSATGAGVFMAFEGINEFAASDWGPQDFRLVWANAPDSASCVIATKVSGINTLNDLKGKKVAWVIGAPGLNIPMTGMLSFANLTWDDVKKVEFPSLASAGAGIKEGTVDAMYTRNDSPLVYELDASPRGVKILEMPHSDKEGWARYQKVVEYMIPTKATAGWGATPEKPLELPDYPYPVVITRANNDTGYVYQMTRMLAENYDDYKKSNTALLSWSPKRQSRIFGWCVPWHEGSIKYFKEKGMWTDEAQKHNDKLIERYKALRAGFDKALDEASEKKIPAKEFPAFWLEKRKGI